MKVVSINLHFCFASALQSFLPGMVGAAVLPPRPAQRKAPEGEQRPLLPNVCPPAPEGPEHSTERSLQKGSAQRNQLANGFLFVI